MVFKTPRAIPFQAIPRQIAEQLQSIPWCAKLINDPEVKPFNIASRVPKSSTEDSMIAETLASLKTVNIWQAFYKPLSSSSASPVGEFIFVLSLGSGLNGHANTLHGGAISLFFDETLSQAAYYHQSSNVKSYTATLAVDFKKPVRTPGLILGRAWLEPRSSGRKLWVRGTFEDGDGGVLALAESLFIEVPIIKSKI